jgi:tRNA(fMet)-specific endonuclease VapC
MKLLDSTFLIDLINGETRIKKIIKNDELYFTTQINMFEVLSGLYFKNLSKKKISDTLDLFENVLVISLDEQAVVKAAEINGELMRKGQRIEDADCLIAGIAMTKGIKTIITDNAKHFSRIPGIKVETY